jgi:hypothetical protein
LATSTFRDKDELRKAYFQAPVELLTFTLVPGEEAQRVLEPALATSAQR